eukprot:TCALIF_08937-PA protein Name:"Similar to Orct Organic cation transporter protein (Drosophila melanogaster)" AED:0.07 eAED:0.07 QI:0/0.6/0.33/0.83/1/1/6/6/587
METELIPLLSGDPSLPPKKKETIDNFDQVLEHIGDFGAWQIILIVLLWLPPLSGGVIVLLSSFTALEPRALRCRQPCDGLYARFEDVDLYGETNSYLDFCQTPRFNGSLSWNQTTCIGSTDFDLDDLSSCQFNTSGPQNVIFQEFEFNQTIVTEWGLICDDQYKVALIGTAYMVGLFLGSFLSSTPADKFGRKTMILVLIAIGGVGDLIGGFAPEYWSYLILRILAGIGEMGMVMTTFTLSVELVGAKQQAFVGNMNQLMFAVGEILMGVLAYFIRDWRQLHFVTAALILPQLLLWFVIPESPRWLLAEGKTKKLPKILNIAQKLNRKSLPPHLVFQEEDEQNLSKKINGKHGLGFKDMFTRRSLLWRTLVMAVNWTVVSMVYYGIGMSMTVLGGNIFLNFILSAVFEILGYIVCILISDHWGRKPVIIVNFLACGIACIISAFVPDSNPAKIPLVLIGKMGSSGAFSTAYVYTAELFPTPIRGTAVGFSSMIGRIGSTVAPQLALFLPSLTFKELPLLIFGIAGLLGGALSFCLPETLGHPLPDTLLEASQQGRKGSSKTLFAWWSKAKLTEEVELQRSRNREMQL